MITRPKLPKAGDTAPVPAPDAEAPPRIDGRSLRRTGRTVQLSTRVTAEFDRQLREAAMRDGKLLAQVLEEGLALYEARAQKKSHRRS
jgi:hypothetical protein